MSNSSIAFFDIQSQLRGTFLGIFWSKGYHLKDKSLNYKSRADIVLKNHFFSLNCRWNKLHYIFMAWVWSIIHTRWSKMAKAQQSTWNKIYIWYFELNNIFQLEENIGSWSWSWELVMCCWCSSYFSVFLSKEVFRSCLSILQTF